MNINDLVSKMLTMTYRPILFSDYNQLKKYVEKISNENEKHNMFYSNTILMSVNDVRKIVSGWLEQGSRKYDVFETACVLLKIYEIEQKTITIPNLFDLKWDHYKNLNLNSSVSYFSSNDNFIAVQFSNYRFVYFYTYSLTGVLGTEYMKILAKSGRGLGAKTSTRFKDGKGFVKTSI